LALLNTIGIALFVPESNKNMQKHLKTEVNPLAPIYRAVTDRKLIARYSFWFIFGTVGSLYQAIFALFLIRAFGFTAAITGIFFTAIGIMMVINQGFVVKRFWLKRFSTSFLEKWPYLFGAISLVLIATQNIYLNILAMIFMVFTQSLIHITTSARFVSLAGEHKKGEVLGVLSAIMSLSAVFGPVIGGVMFERNISLPFYFGALLMLIVFFFMFLTHNKEKKLKISDESIAAEPTI
jgi:MFS family permease